jgi:hypothetical protein
MEIGKPEREFDEPWDEPVPQGEPAPAPAEPVTSPA